mmetsp:Transcript_8369/g.10073  ORF Transcript_8369/g.10073 Transcript_8369/m.10073 type:complete len:216 (-) Transcript_8369:23-670(-)
MSSTAPAPKLDVLCILDAYASAHDKGNAELKSSFWNLNKARRQKGRNCSISALDVREDLLAQTILSEPTPGLQDEDNGGGGDGHDAMDGIKTQYEEDTFTLQNAAKVIQESRSIAASNTTATTASTGLRQRKASSKVVDEDESEWTQINHTDVDDDEPLRDSDPINLFGGLVPRDLRASQTQAKEAMASYVEAANLAVAILQATQKVETKDDASK